MDSSNPSLFGGFREVWGYRGRGGRGADRDSPGNRRPGGKTSGRRSAGEAEEGAHPRGPTAPGHRLSSSGRPEKQMDMDSFLTIALPDQGLPFSIFGLGLPSFFLSSQQVVFFRV